MIFDSMKFSTLAIFATFLLASHIPAANGARILFVFPFSSRSVANLFEPLVKRLVERGHQVKVFTPTHFNIQSPNLTQVQPVTSDQLYGDCPEPFELRKQSKLFSFQVPHQQKYCHQLFQLEELRNLENEKYDVIVQNIIHHDCFAGLWHKIGSPIILFGSAPIPSAMTELLGNHHPSSFIPIGILSDVSAQLAFLQRTKNFLYNAYFSIMLEYMTRPYLEDIYREHLGQDLPSITEIYRKQASLMLMNSHFAVTRPRPLLPNIVEIGGIHCKPAKPLPKDLEEFVAGAKDGFIVFSLGSIVKATSMPESVRQAFVQTFAKLKQRVIWKWEKDGGMPDLPSNVKLVKWLPQQDLLGHPNIRLFITHGGLLSTEEAVYHGVPVLGMPVFVDQDANMIQAEDLGFGVKGEILDLTEPQLTPLVRHILNDPRYMRKAKELSAIFRDEQESPVDRAVYWVEYVIRNNGAYHLRSAAANLSLIQYHSVDVLAFLLLLVVLSIMLPYYVLKLLFGMLGRRLNNRKTAAPKKKMR